MSVAADTYLPAVWTLDSANVQAIESSKSDPKTRLDETGLFLTDATGARVTQIRGPGGAIDILASIAATAPTERRVRWIRASDGSVMADLSGFENSGHGSLELEAVSAVGAIPGLRTGIEAFSDGSTGSFVEAHTRTTGPPSVLRQSEIILDDAGRSDFLRGVQLHTFGVTGPWNGAINNFNMTSPATRALVIGHVTGWSSVAAGIGATMYVNGTPIDGGACPAGSPVNAHTPLSLMMGIVNLPAGNNTFQFLTTAGTPGSDGGDIGRFLVIG